MANDWPMDQAQAKVEWSREDERRRMMAQQNAIGQAGSLAGLGAAPMPPRTLASALSALDALNKRLAETTSKALQLATMIGGPVPAAGSITGVENQANKPSAMELLNNTVQECHNRVNALSAGLDAMSRSLGALDG